jgi:hypothetical protein
MFKNLEIMANKKKYVYSNPNPWVPKFNSMELEDDQILLYLAENRRTPQTPDEEELLKEINALKSRGYGIEIPF